MKIYIGFDPAERIAYQVAANSILSRTRHADIIRLGLADPHVNRLLSRPIKRIDGKLWCPISDAPMSTEHAHSRFCVPFLQDKEFALFCDGDILCRANIAELFDLANKQFAVQVVKHDQIINETVKKTGHIQTIYPRKNWSSVVLWNCAHPAHRRLTTEHLNTWPGRDLHAFKWLTDDEIGGLPPEWNYLVGCSKEDVAPKIIHFTLGGPWLPNWGGGPYDDLWKAELESIHNITN